MKLTINIDPKDILAVTSIGDERACVSMSIGNNIEVHLTVEELADDVIEMLEREERTDEFCEGEYIVYQNGDRYELGKIRRITDDGAFVHYSRGSTAEKTPFECMHKLVNAYVIDKTGLGGGET